MTAGHTADHFGGGTAYSQHSYLCITFHKWGDPRDTDGYEPEGAPFGKDIPAYQKTYTAATPQQVHAFSGQGERTSVLTMSAQKSLGQAAGAFSIQLKGTVEKYSTYDGLNGDTIYEGQEWDQVLHDGDWCEINVVVNGGKQHIMVGRIDSISARVSASDDAITKTVTVVGRDVGAIPEDVPVYFNPYDPNHANPAGVKVAELLGPDAILTGSPSEIAVQVLSAFSSGGVYGQQPSFPAGMFGDYETTFADALDKSRVSPTRGKVHAASMLSVTSSGSLWEYASSFVVPQFNEMIIDTLATTSSWMMTGLSGVGDSSYHVRTVNLTIRERPFVNLSDGGRSPWFKLTPIVVDLSEIQNLSLSKGKNRINQIHVMTQMPSGMGQESMALFPPAVDIQSAKRWGLRRLEQRTQHAFGASGNIADTDEPKHLRNLLVHWNVLNPYYYTGMITLARLRPDIRVGTKIVLVGAGLPIWPTLPPADAPVGTDCGSAMTFYVEGVQYMMQGGEMPTMQTQLMVSRGYPDDKRFEDITILSSYWSDATDGQQGACMSSGTTPATVI